MQNDYETTCVPDLDTLADWGKDDAPWVAALKKPEAQAKIVDSGTVIILEGGAESFVIHFRSFVIHCILAVFWVYS